MATIYRIQNEKGEGPYWTSRTLPDPVDRMIRSHSCESIDQHPTPVVDIINAGGPATFSMRPDYLCGFETLEQLHD